MKQINTLLKSVCIIAALTFSCVSFGQQTEPAEHEVIDKNPIYKLKGNGHETRDGRNRIIFSQMTTQGGDSREVSLNNSEITVNKDGIYRVSISSSLTEEELQNKLANYSVNLNGKEVFGTNYHTFPLSGKYDFQIQLKKGDKLSFNITKNEEHQNTPSVNTLEVRFTDPELITVIENH